VSAVGAYIVLTRDDAKLLFAQKEDAAIRKTVEQLRSSAKRKSDGLILECGTDWDAIQRALTEGKLEHGAGEFPLDHCVLGGKRLHQGKEFDAILIRPDIVPHVAQGLHDLKRDAFVEKYLALDPADYGRQPTATESDRIWSTLKLIRQLFEDAANEHAAVVFTVAY
jgi:hypothetical protein